MYHIIFGPPGAGKSSLLTHFLERVYFEHGRELLSRTREKIQAINEKYGTNYTAPDQPPIYADYDVRLHVGYEEWYEPYFINGFYFGLPNDVMKQMQLVPPGSKIFLGEVQRYYNSRKSQSLPDHVSREYEMHRHFDIEIFMDIQRPELVDVNIRGICKHFIEVLKMVHARDKLGRIVQTKFYVREFESWLDVEQYQKSGEKTYKEPPAVYTQRQYF